jgi:hypothetical protein
MNPRIVLAGAVLVVALAALGSYLYFSQRPTINVLEIQGDSQVNQWQCAKYAVAARPSLSNRLSAVDFSTSGISTKFYSDSQCQLEVTSIPLDKSGVLTSPGGQVVQYGSFYFYSSAPPHTENVVATGKLSGFVRRHRGWEQNHYCCPSSLAPLVQDADSGSGGTDAGHVLRRTLQPGASPRKGSACQNR